MVVGCVCQQRRLISILSGQQCKTRLPVRSLQPSRKLFIQIPGMPESLIKQLFLIEVTTFGKMAKRMDHSCWCKSDQAKQELRLCSGRPGSAPAHSLSTQDKQRDGEGHNAKSLILHLSSHLNLLRYSSAKPTSQSWTAN